MELDSTAKVKRAFFRLVDTEADDPELTLLSEGTNEVVELLLTRGFRAAQRWMLEQGYQGWRKRSSALTFTGTDAADGGRSTNVPTDFLKAYGNKRRSCLSEANGDRWGTQIDPDDPHRKADHFYFRGSDDKGMQLWLARTASEPATVYLEYHYLHPKWESLADADIDFPLENRFLGVAEAATFAMVEAWLPGGPELEVKIQRALVHAQREARRTVRATKQPREMLKLRRFANRWAVVPFLSTLLGAVI